MIRRLVRPAVFLLALLSMAHVGSPDTFFNGQAGPYPVQVAIRLPGVIPGLAQIAVRVAPETGDAIKKVTVQAIQWNVGPDGAPPADPAAPVPGDPTLYSAELWFMGATSYRVHVVIDGPRGQGVAVVPVLALATAQREMSPALGAILAGLGIFLVVGLLTIIVVGVRESVVPPGETPDPSRRRRARIALAVGVVIIGLMLAGGRAWWDAEAFAYAESVLYRPFRSEAAVREDAGRRLLTLTINDRRWSGTPNPGSRYNALMPDHGKLMHMFLVREPALDVFAHVHPVARDRSAKAFDLQLPPLPAGRYRVYGDIVHESGYAQTLVAAADVPEPGAGAGTADPDDSWFQGAAAPQGAQPVYRAADGSTITWAGAAEPFKVGDERLLTFVARDGSGGPLAIEPYMGMLGHVAVSRVDGDVFAHLHPSGSISMAAWQKFARLRQGSGEAGDAHAAHASAPASSEVSTLYAFPRPGRYRLWVQMKRRAGDVITAPFDVNVE